MNAIIILFLCFIAGGHTRPELGFELQRSVEVQPQQGLQSFSNSREYQQLYQNQQNLQTLSNSYQQPYRNQQNRETFSSSYQLPRRNQEYVQSPANSYGLPNEVQRNNFIQPYGVQQDFEHLKNIPYLPQQKKMFYRNVYTYMIEYANGFKRFEKGYVKQGEDGKSELIVDGSFTHVGTEGTKYKVDYTSDVGKKPKGPKTGIGKKAIGSLGGGV